MTQEAQYLKNVIKEHLEEMGEKDTVDFAFRDEIHSISKHDKVNFDGDFMKIYISSERTDVVATFNLNHIYSIAYFKVRE